LAVGSLGCGWPILAAEPPMVLRPAQPNPVTFDPVTAKFVRMIVRGDRLTQPCIDELEVFGPASDKNLALAAAGAKATASSCLVGYAAHSIAHLNDGQYGNDRSWIPDDSTGWAQIELPQAVAVNRVVFSRDRQGHFADRLPTAFEIQVSTEGKAWQTVKKVASTRFLHPEPTYMATNEPIALEFPACEARYVRVAIKKTSGGQPCIDELEIYGAAPDKNLALASSGAVASASSCLEGYAIHRVEHLNDGQGGNDRSWIAAEGSGWAQIELPATATVQRVVFARDRKGQYDDRLPQDVEISVSLDGRTWTPVKQAIALEGLRPELQAPGENVRQWARRIVLTLPAGWRDGLKDRVASVRDEKDIRELLKMVRQERELRTMRTRLALEFNPEALHRTMADLAATYPGRFPPAGAAEQLAVYEKQLPELEKLFQSGQPEDLHQAADLSRQMIEFQRKLLLSNPLLDFEEILVLDRKRPETDRGDTYWLWGQQYGMTVNWSCDFRPKNPPVAPWWCNQIAAFKVRDFKGRSESPSPPAPLPASGARGKAAPRTIYKAADGNMIQHPELHFDADRLMFSMPDEAGAFQVFEVRIDGTGLRQVTRDTGPDVDNGDPCYLPDGRIIFNSTRMFTGVPCEDGESYVSNLCLTNADGSGTRLLTVDQESAWHPSMLNDGRVLFTRYEYANISHQFARLLFHMNPDGTTQSEYYGSNSYWPNSIFYARAIPNHPTKVVGVVCGHHGPNKTGRLVLFDPAVGRHETSGAIQTIPGYGKPVQRIVADELYGADWPKFAHPWPLNDKYYLVAARLHPEQIDYAIYLVDIFDTITEVARIENHSLFEPIPLAKRKTPPAVPDRVQPEAKEATVYLADIYQGPGLVGVPRGTVKKLRVFTYNYVYRHTSKRGFGHLATPGVDGPWEPRFLLGTVPVREDGSALFSVPANTPITVQPLDDQNRAVQQMRSWFTAMPGEVLSCVGCHEQQNSTPRSYAAMTSMGKPARIEPWRGPARGFDFAREVQPVLDHHCTGCHDGQRPGRPDLARKSEEEKLRINREYHAATESMITTVLTPAYIALHPYVRRPHAESHYGAQAAGEYLADTSPLVQMLQRGHHGVQLDAEAWDRLYTWIDLGAPDQGSWRLSEWGTPANYYERRLETLRQFAGRTDDVEWMPEGEPPVPPFVAPPQEQSLEAAPACPGWPMDTAEAQQRQQAAGLPATMSLKLADGLVIDLVLVPPGEFILGDAAGRPNERPATRVRIERPFYLGRTEVTNAQYAALAASHQSGFVAWMSIDWRGEGHPLNEPNQPVVRVSWQEAMQFAQAVAARTGQRVTLPTEAQWEWACRAGTAAPTWYGGRDDDFSAFENLAGRELRTLAFWGKPKWYLRDDRFEDPAPVTAAVGAFRPNPWGLCDMLGNVREWTRSSCRPYPYDPATDLPSNDENDEKTVRGGSWCLRPADAGAALRWKYPAWRKVHDVGFRIAVEVE
jgi:formylglycine-generating enzyme required for sulfatase activity/uncharacterized protein YifN (PemK superfamily)